MESTDPSFSPKHNNPEMFFSTYLKIVEEYRENEDENNALVLHNMINKEVRTVENVLHASANVKRFTVRPQRLLHDDKDYYIAIDMLTNTYYICYRTLLMLDIDFYKPTEEVEVSKEDIINKLEKYAKENKLRFRLYQSRNGIHAFLINRESNYKNPEDTQIMIDLDVDFFYIVYSNIRGWSVRLNRKKNEEKMSYTYICDVGDETPIEHLEKLVELHINLVPVFENVDACLSFGN